VLVVAPHEQVPAHGARPTVETPRDEHADEQPSAASPSKHVTS